MKTNYSKNPEKQPRFMHSYKELLLDFESQFAEYSPFPQHTQNLYEPCRYLLEEGGKRIRPILCLMANELFGEINRDGWQAAYGIELFHNFTLIHDDIMDKAPLRRGRPTIHAKFGLTAGILCGDVMNIFAYDAFTKLESRLPQVLQVFNKTAIEVCEGQQLDMDYESRNDVSMDEYLHMIALKTSVLLACSLKIGALTGGSVGNNADKLYDFGRNLGIAFQLMDDYLDAFGDSGKTGKQTGGDILSNKKTYLLIKAQENADAAQKIDINNLLLADGANKIEKMLTLYKSTGADKACLDAIAEYSNLAFACFEEVAIPSKRKKPLFELAEFLLKRDK